MLEETPPEYEHDQEANEGDISISFLSGYHSSVNYNNLRIPMVRQGFDFHNNIQDVYLVSGGDSPMNETHPFHSNEPNEVKTPMISKSSDIKGHHLQQQIFDTPYLNQLYAEYVPNQGNSNANNSMSMSINHNTHNNSNHNNSHHHQHNNDDELPSLSDISILNFRSDTPLGSFKTPKGSKHAQIIGASTLKKITGLISTPLKSGPLIDGKLSDDDGVGKRSHDDSDTDSNNDRNSPCVKHQFHLNNSSYSNSTASHIFTQNSFKGDITNDSTVNSTGNNHINNGGKNFQLFNDFSPTVTRKVIKPLSRSTTMASTQLTPIKPHNINFKTPDSANSTSSTIVLNSTSKQAPGHVNQSGLDLSPTPRTKSFLIVRDDNTSTPGKNMNLPSVGNFGPPLLGTFKQKCNSLKSEMIIQPRKKSKSKFNSGSTGGGGQQFQFIMTDTKKFTQGSGKSKRQSSSILKDSTNTVKRKKVSNKQ